MIIMSREKPHLLNVLACLLVLVPALGGCQEVKPGQAVVEIHTAQGIVDYQAEVAVTRSQKSRGLMHREHMPRNHGMLFLYDPPRKTGMWMKNTHIPLDMLFIDADGRIVKIEENTEPMSTHTISSGEKVRAVLELNAGQAAEHGIKPGDRVEYSIAED